MEAMDVETVAYVDDTGALAERPRSLNTALAVTKEFEELTGQEVHPVKSICFSASSPQMKRLKFGTHRLPRADCLKVVGVELDMQG
eukprot:872884-Karenia_brevis.AAC.1